MPVQDMPPQHPDYGMGQETAQKRGSGNMWGIEMAEGMSDRGGMNSRGFHQATALTGGQVNRQDHPAGQPL